ncbi:MAG: DNA repair protein RadA [Microthrixaceae bacterium]
MATSARSTRFACLHCGWTTNKWVGRCDGCGEWNGLVEEPVPPAGGAEFPVVPLTPALPLTAVSGTDATPHPTGIAELDRVLGGGLVPGSVTLLGGEPGVGKSTLLLQILGEPARRGDRCLYVSAEESAAQVRRRAERVGVLHDGIHLAAATNLDHIDAHLDAVSPDLVVVDSIQTVFDPALGSGPGSVGQVRQCAHRLVTLAKERDLAMVLVGHVTKDGDLAGPRVLEHVVDTVLSFEGDRHQAMRMVRAVKHRFGSTGEVGLLTMEAGGLASVSDPSKMFLADRNPRAPGSAVTAILDGHRPILVEIQALLVKAAAAHPRRSVSGLDGSRVGLLAAVLEKRVGIEVLGLDWYAMAVGGARASEPACDLAIALAATSALTGYGLPHDTVYLGEVGLGGELRSVHGLERRLAEAARFGFEHAIVPTSGADVRAPIELIPCKRLDDAVGAIANR